MSGRLSKEDTTSVGGQFGRGGVGGRASCSLEARKFQAALPAIRSQNAEIIGVSPQGPTDHAQFCSSLGLEFPLVSDSDGVLAKAYGAQQEVPLFGTFTVSVAHPRERLWTGCRVDVLRCCPSFSPSRRTARPTSSTPRTSSGGRIR
eukprot:scaffold842_cov227-Pinguiococcus_pyrenoidosus.AAC.2